MYILQRKTISLNFICKDNNYLYIWYYVSNLCKAFWIHKIDVLTIYIAEETFVFPRNTIGSFHIYVTELFIVKF